MTIRASASGQFPCELCAQKIGGWQAMLVLRVASERIDTDGNRHVRAVSHRTREFEAFLVDLSSSFVNVAADQVDAQIISGLRRVVEFLGIERSGLGQLTPTGDRMAITHSYQVPGVPPTPKVVVKVEFPSYAANFGCPTKSNTSRMPPPSAST